MEIPLLFENEQNSKLFSQGNAVSSALSTQVHLFCEYAHGPLKVRSRYRDQCTAFTLKALTSLQHTSFCFKHAQKLINKDLAAIP